MRVPIRRIIISYREGRIYREAGIPRRRLSAWRINRVVLQRPDHHLGLGYIQPNPTLTG